METTKMKFTFVTAICSSYTILKWLGISPIILEKKMENSKTVRTPFWYPQKLFYYFMCISSIITIYCLIKIEDLAHTPFMLKLLHVIQVYLYFMLYLSQPKSRKDAEKIIINIDIVHSADKEINENCLEVSNYLINRLIIKHTIIYGLLVTLYNLFSYMEFKTNNIILIKSIASIGYIYKFAVRNVFRAWMYSLSERFSILNMKVLHLVKSHTSKRDLSRIQNVHLELCEVWKRINNLYGIPMVLALSIDYLSFIAIAHRVYILWHYKNPKMKIVWEIIILSARIGALLLDIVLTAIACTNTVQNVS